MGSDATRLFFALWPDTQLRAVLVRVGRDAAVPRCRPVVPDNLHLTLAFLGTVPAHRVASVHAAADKVDAAPVDLVLDRLEQWPRPQLTCATASVLPESLAHLVGQLRAALVEYGLPSESRPFRPHVTLLRKVRRRHPPTILPAAVRWQADRFWLVASESRPEGVRYTPLHSWPLAGRRSPDHGHVE